MQLVDGERLYAASDLVSFLRCAHLNTLRVRRLNGELQAPPKRAASTADLAVRKGEEHEERHLEAMSALHGEHLVAIECAGGAEGLSVASDLTREAMQAGAPVIYQATFLEPPWMGYADFLERVEGSSVLGDWSYVPIDAKLARSVKPHFVIQLCSYAELLENVQGCPPERLGLILGDGSRPSLRSVEFSSYFERIKARFLATMAGDAARSYPLPVEHCEMCEWAERCEERWIADDHLCQVANLGREQAVKLAQCGVETVVELAGADSLSRPRGMSERTFAKLRSQATLQVSERQSGERSLLLLEPSNPDQGSPRGFGLLPEPSEGDLFFDIEGDPFYEDGLEYLWGVSFLEDGVPRFRSFWGLDRAEEKAAFEAFVDFVDQRRETFPDLHVYHYAPYERTALGRMMGLHASREDEVDRLFRERVLVDLYRVVEQSMQISRPSYSLKEVEHFYNQDREAEVKQAGDSVLMFEEWRESGNHDLLAEIEAYNKEDCDSTLRLRDWLLDQRGECEELFDVRIPPRPPAAQQDTDDPALGETAELVSGLLAGVPDDPEKRSPEQANRWLLAQLLDYHRRDAKPGWWEFFDRLDRSEVALIEQDSEALGGLRRVGDPEPMPPPARSSIQRFSFPVQEHKIGVGKYPDPHSCGTDPFTGESDRRPKSVEVVEIDDQAGTLSMKLSAERLTEEQTALIPKGPLQTDEQRAALRGLAREVLRSGLERVETGRAAVDILRRALPRSKTVAAGAPLQGESVELEDLEALVGGLQESYLFIQGPPGSGKTYTGAHLIVELIASGRTVGVTANSHKAINNLLAAIEAQAQERGVEVRGLKKSSGGEQDYKSSDGGGEPLIQNSKRNQDFEAPGDKNLLAGTAWLWCREGMRRAVDFLVIDEAGQISLADALALCTATSNVVLLGDPLQLAQVSQGAHPPGSGVSVLEHLLGSEGTVPRERGIFLDKTRRMHPDVCRFVSAAIYEDRLGWMDFCERQRIEAGGDLSGTGVRSIAVPHRGNSRQSLEEAEVIGAAIESLAGAAFTDRDGVTTELRQDQILVVTPYNSQVRCLRNHLKDRGLAGVEVGTVDKFQGQEGAVVFFSMATSSGAEIPRNVEFLYSRNRLNVAVSRAQCLAVLVASPALMEIDCKTVEQMRLLNALCLLDDMGRAGLAGASAEGA